MSAPTDPPVPRPLPERATCALFLVVLALHLAAVTVGWRHGMLPGNTFRQAQTALTTYFIAQEPGLSLAYPTPVLGKPWSIPMEFPLYEWTVAGLRRLSSLPLVECARLVTLACFYLTLPALWWLLAEFGVDRARRWLVLAFVPACPVYVFYSRAVLIESMALMFAAWFLTAFLTGLRRASGRWLLAAMLLGVIAILAKVTTVFLFLVPAGGFLLHPAWRAARAESAARAGSWRRVAWAAASLVPIAAAGLAWVAYGDAVKAHNPAADMLMSGPQRLYNFGVLADRWSGEYWRRWSGMVCTAAIHPAVLAAVALAAGLAARRWRSWILGGAALFFLAPAVFPFLYAWHDYYYYANAAFLAVAMGFAAVAVLDSRLPRALGALLVIGGLFLQGRLYATHYLPQQRIASDGQTGLSRALYDLTAPDDVLVVAGQDWNAELPWATRRRALMIRHGFEENDAYLRRAFGDLRGEFVAALVITGDVPNRAGLVELARTSLGICPEPIFAYENSQVFVNAAIRDEWSSRLPLYAQDRVQVLSRNESARTPLAGDPRKIHGRAVFDGLAPSLVRYEVPYTLVRHPLRDRTVFSLHAPGRLWFDPGAGRHGVRIGFGILDSAWQGDARTNGVDFQLRAVTSTGSRLLWHRLLDPAANPADRGPQAARCTVELQPGEQLQVFTDPNGSNSFDWAYIAELRIE
ncbi:MAG: glycosyltransferase family 39 protein [Verrucomicrobia bacterium]|nr:glycosyltransferase family 39 protein [Verrucomicrobiota bacterium]